MSSIKQYLNDVLELGRKIDCDTAEINRLREWSAKITTGQGESVSGSREQNAKYTRAIDAITDLEREVTAELSEYREKRMGVVKIIEPLTVEERIVIVLRYIIGLDWDEIASHTHYSRRHVLRIHAAAVKKLEENKICH